MEENSGAMVRALFRKGDPHGVLVPSGSASIRKNEGWFIAFGGVSDLPIDETVVSAEDIAIYAEHLTENGFFGSNAWYVNGKGSTTYLQTKADVRLSMRVLFVLATYDYVCDTTTTAFADPIRKLCPNLT